MMEEMGIESPDLNSSRNSTLVYHELSSIKSEASPHTSSTGGELKQSPSQPCGDQKKSYPVLDGAIEIDNIMPTVSPSRDLNHSRRTNYQSFENRRDKDSSQDLEQSFNPALRRSHVARAMRLYFAKKLKHDQDEASHENGHILNHARQKRGDHISEWEETETGDNQKIDHVIGPGRSSSSRLRRQPCKESAAMSRSRRHSVTVKKDTNSFHQPTDFDDEDLPHGEKKWRHLSTDGQVVYLSDSDIDQCASPEIAIDSPNPTTTDLNKCADEGMSSSVPSQSNTNVASPSRTRTADVQITPKRPIVSKILRNLKLTPLYSPARRITTMEELDEDLAEIETDDEFMPRQKHENVTTASIGSLRLSDIADDISVDLSELRQRDNVVTPEPKRRSRSMKRLSKFLNEVKKKKSCFM